MTLIPGPWTAELINHLWQSTIFTAVAWLLALALRRNQARTRYWLWMIASVKFLIPFSLLIIAGGYLRSVIAVPTTKPALSVVIDQVAQPFSQAKFSQAIATTTVTQTAVTHRAMLLPLLLGGIWLCGSLIFAFSWGRKWRNIRATVRAALPITLVADVPVMSSSTLLEPGVFGILRPVLLLPEGITSRLTEPQLRAILNHEMWHVRRRDNLTAAIHMVVEVLFWFHPLVWWIRTRLIEERERACDEAVLQSGNEGHVYAEGILNVCKFYVESPLACVSGVTGSDLKKRIARIMTEQVARRLDLRRKLLLASAGLLAVILPITFGLVHATRVQAQATAATTVHDLVGSWQGTLQAGKELRIVLKVSKTASGWKADLYSIDQGGQAIPATAITLQGSDVKFSIEMIDGTYEGKLSGDGNSIAGTWTQGGKPLPLNLTRATPATEWSIPAPPPVIPPMAADASPGFEVATIKPSIPGKHGKWIGFRGRQVITMNFNVNDLIAFAYGLHTKQIVNAPAWFGTDLYDVAGVPDVSGRPNQKQMKVMLQKLLTDRFNLKFHNEKRVLSVYVITVTRSGPKMKKSSADANDPVGFLFRGLGDLVVRNMTMADFATGMQSVVMDRPVVDQTGLIDRYDFLLKWTLDESQFAQFRGTGVKSPSATNDPNAPPSLYTAIQEQLGLKLEATKAPDDVIVIDHVEKPSEN